MANLFDYNIKRVISFRLLKGTEKTIPNLGLVGSYWAQWEMKSDEESLGRDSGADWQC